MIDFQRERIVVTGGAGFLGRHLQVELLARGLPPENLLVPRSEDFDLTREDDVVRMYQHFQPTVVIHMAAKVGGIGANRANPGLKKFVQVGTICAYPKFTPVPFREEDLWAGYPEDTNAPYAIAKKALLVMLQAYRQQYALNGIYLLPVNLYGPGDNFHPENSHVIPALVRKFVDARQRGNDEVVVWGSGLASREFLYVEDAARAVALAAQRYESGEPVNIGAGFEITIRDLVAKIRNLVGFEGRVVWDTSKPDGQPRRSLDTTRARQFGFQATTSFDEGLRRTIDWWCEQKLLGAEKNYDRGD
jgi:GDP-L-fucose synthase